MPSDSSPLPTAEGGAPAKKGGIPTWMLLAGAGVGVVVLILLISQGGGGGSGAPATTAAGTSINAALGSIQEEQLNTMGQMGVGFQNVSTMFGDTQTQIGQGFTDLTNNMSDQFGATNNLITSGFAQQSQQMDTGFNRIYGQVAGVSNQIGSVSDQVNSLDSTLNQEMQQINTGIYNGQQLDQATQNSLLQQDQSIIALINQVEQGLGGSIGTTKGEILTLAYQLGKGQQAQNYLTGQGDYTQTPIK